MTTHSMTAREAGLLACPVCRLVSRAPAAGQAAHCPRCAARLHARKPASLARTWALLVAAALLYVPANMLPIMDTRSLFGAKHDTILSGIAHLWATGSQGLALLVFFASVLVPLVKLFVLGYLAYAAQRGERRGREVRARLYRSIEFIGRWSMLDIYVVTILVALLSANSLAEVHAGPGAIAFGAVVVLTILAASSFDPRLNWDAADKETPAHAAPRPA